MAEESLERFLHSVRAGGDSLRELRELLEQGNVSLLEFDERRLLARGVPVKGWKEEGLFEVEMRDQGTLVASASRGRRVCGVRGRRRAKRVLVIL